MMKKYVGAIALVALVAATSAAQDARTVISNASKAMGVDGLNSITFYGAGANFNLGQNNNSNAPVVEGFAGDKRVFSDATRTFEIYVIKGLPHADGLVIGYLPKEKILVYADGGHDGVCGQHRAPAAGARPAPFDPALVPDRLTTVAEIKASLGRK